MFIAGKKLKNSMKRNKITVWLMLFVCSIFPSIRDKKQRYFNRLAIGMIIAALVLLPLVLPGTVYADGVTPDVEAGMSHTVALDSHGRVWVWGSNGKGQLGIGALANYDTTVPVQVTALSGKTITAITAGYYHTLARASDGTIWAWGDNNLGTLGDGTELNESMSPVQVTLPSGVDIVALAAGESHSAALDSSGGVWTWGDNGYHKLGLEDTAPRLVPTQVTALSAKVITAIAAGREHTLALADDGTAWAWGVNSGGKLGLGDTAEHTIPEQVTIPGNGSIAVIAAGRNHTLAAKTDGTAWVWGSELYGMLGNGVATNTFQSSPVQINGLSGVTGLKGGYFASMAMLANGTVYNWGRLKSPDINQTVPLQVSGLDNAVDIGMGRSTNSGFFVYKNDGTIWSWGNDTSSIGRVVDRFTPGQVSGGVVLSGASLTETNLNGAQLTLDIVLDSFASSVNASQFTLNNAPTGTSITDASLSEGKCILTLAYDGTDFDTDFNNFSVTVAEAAVNGANGMTSNSLSISAVNEPRVTPDQALSEANLNGRTLAVVLQTGTFADGTLDISNFSLNDAPPGMTLAGVEYTSETGCNVTLAYDGTDFDSNISFSITIASSEFSDGNPQTTDRISVTPRLETVVVTSDAALAASNLNGRLLSVILVNDTFRDNTLVKANFTLNNAPAGLSVGSVFYNDSTHCVVILSYDGTPFSSDINNFSLTIKAEEVSSKGDVTGNSLTITAQSQALSISTANLPAAIVGTAYSATVQATGGMGAYTWSATGLPAGLDIDSATGEISGTPQAVGSSQITFTVGDGNGGTANKALTLQVKLTAGSGKYTISPVSDSSYTINTVDGIAAMTANSGSTGFRYFTVNVTPVEAHDGDEVVVFVQLRNGTQLSMNATSADFDSINRAKAGFNVQSGDIIKAYIVDDLTNEEDFNPILLQ